MMKTLLKITAISFLVAVFLAASLNAEDAKIGKAKEYHKEIPVRVIKEVPLPKGYHEGLYLEGKNIWVNNGKNGNTWIVNLETGKVIKEIKPIGTFTEGITSAGDGSFWVTDWDTKKLYRADLEGDQLVEEYAVSMDPAHPAGVVAAGDKVYVIIWTRGMGTKYHILEYDTHGNRMRKLHIKGIHEPSQLAWDGKDLWITSWYTRLVYRLDISTFEITGSFKSPAPDTTGIVWDGKTFWITGTHVGLYQVEFEK